MNPPAEVLFVCTGNICRSPTAERLTMAWAAEQGAVSVHATSSGTRAVVDADIDPTAAVVLAGLGGDAEAFHARQLTAGQVVEADLVLTMTTRHQTRVLELEPRALHRTFTLREAARLIGEGHDPEGGPLVAQLVGLRSRFPGTDDDIDDPFRREEGSYEAVGTVIADALLVVLPALAASAPTATPTTARAPTATADP